MPASEYLLWQRHLERNPPAETIVMNLLAKMGYYQDIFFRTFAKNTPDADPSDWFFWLPKDQAAKEADQIESTLARSAKAARERAEKEKADAEGTSDQG